MHNNAYDGQGESKSYRPSDAIRNDENKDEDLKRCARIDLLIDRNDKTVSVCEMKYADKNYEIAKLLSVR